MGLVKEQVIFTKHISELIAFADLIGVELTFGDAWRSKSQMLLNYFGYEVVQGESIGIKLVKSKVLSKTLKSKHGKRLAVDFNFFIDGQLYYNHPKIDELGEFWEKLDNKNRWGGNFKRFKDTPHFERNV